MAGILQRAVERLREEGMEIEAHEIEIRCTVRTRNKAYIWGRVTGSDKVAYPLFLINFGPTGDYLSRLTSGGEPTPAWVPRENQAVGANS